MPIKQTLEGVFMDSMGRIQKLTATPADLALVLIMSELIDEVGGSTQMAKQIRDLEAKWQQGLAEYAKGRV
jgi:hypothetical protein